MTDNDAAERGAEDTQDHHGQAAGPQGWEPYGPPAPQGWEPYAPPAPAGWEPYGPPAPGGWEPYAPPARGPQGWEPYAPPAAGQWVSYAPLSQGSQGGQPYGPPRPAGWEPDGPPAPQGWEPYGPPSAAGVPRGGQLDRPGWASGFVRHLASSSESPGVWVLVTGSGWKQLSPGPEPDAPAARSEQNGHADTPSGKDGHSHLTQLALLAKNYRLPVSYHEDAYGRIDRLIV